MTAGQGQNEAFKIDFIDSNYCQIEKWNRQKMGEMITDTKGLEVIKENYTYFLSLTRYSD